MINYCYLESPLGTLRLVSDGTALNRLELPDLIGADGELADSQILREARRQLLDYFAGKRRTFDLPLAARGTDFQRQVWRVLTHIPFGDTRSYAAIARQLKRPRAVRAVGAANGKNPLPIIVPCHRVIGSNGSLTGYAGGLAAKKQLLALEGVELGRESAGFDRSQRGE